MSTYTTTTNRLALRCDHCGGTFHPRTEAQTVRRLRVAAWNQGWAVGIRVGEREVDYCCAEHERLAQRIVSGGGHDGA